MAKKAKKRPARKTSKSRSIAAKRRSASRKPKAAKTAARKAKPVRRAPTPRKAKPVRNASAPRKAKRPARAAPKLTARTVRQRALGAEGTKPTRRVVEIDEERERAETETVQLGKQGFAESDDLAEELGEAFVTTATSGEQAEEDIRDEEVPEERGGPFVITKASTEFAMGSDESNPPDAEPAGVPTTSSEESD